MGNLGHVQMFEMTLRRIVVDALRFKYAAKAT